MCTDCKSGINSHLYLLYVYAGHNFSNRHELHVFVYVEKYTSIWGYELIKSYTKNYNLTLAEMMLTLWYLRNNFMDFFDERMTIPMYYLEIETLCRQKSEDMLKKV